MDDVATRLARTIAITWTTAAMIDLRIGHHQDRQQFPTGNGYSIDVATEYKRRRPEFE